MATLALSLAGQVVGGVVGGPIGATVGRALGALAGAAIDSALFGERPQPAATAGADIRLTGSSEGAPIPRLYGWSRLAGNIIWATELEELTTTSAGSKGFGPPPEPEVERTLLASFAVAFCEGPVNRLGRVWADGQLLDTSGLVVRFYDGSETQQADSLIEAVQGEGNAPAYRGTCYLVFERLPLGPFGNRIPSIAVELCRAVGELEPSIRAINVIPGAGEFVYDPVPRVRLVSPGVTASENTHVGPHVSDWTVSIDELTALCPNLERVQLVIAWFGDDLRCGHCTIAPRTEGTIRSIEGTAWSVAGLTRATAPVASYHEGALAYGGTPSDNAVRAAIADLKARGLEVILYPLLMMDIPADNPMGQPAYPWRGRITCDPAPGAPGSPDGTATAAAQVAAFVPGYRAFLLHYAALAAAAGADGIIIGSEMKGLTAVRGASDSFPFVDALVALAQDVRTIVGSDCAITYAADWSEATGHQPGAGAKYFHLDPLWASPAIDAVGIDNYMPIADWRDGTDHADAAAWDGPYDPGYLRAGIAGGEGFDWYYASDADRIDGVRTPITDGAYGEPWIWRFKDLRSWWSNPHHNRPGGVRSGLATAWVPESKPIWFTELGCGAVDKGANQPSAFADAKSIENTRPFFSNGTPDALMQRQLLRAHFAHWADPAANPVSSIYGGPMVDPGRIAPWAWDARPFPAFPTQREAWGDWPNYATGHWLNGRLGGLAADEAIRAVAADYGFDVAAADPDGPLLHGYTAEGVVSAREVLAPVLAATGLSLRDTAAGLAFIRTSARAPFEVARAELAVTDGPITSRRRPDPTEQVGQVGLGYLDRARGYLAAAATAITPAGGNAVNEPSPLVLDAAGARLAAERMLAARAAAPETIEFALPPSAIGLEAGDAIALEGESEGPFEITAIRDGAVRRIAARNILPPLELAVTADAPRAATSAPVVRAVPIVVAAHLPPDPTRPDTARLLLAASSTPWPGRVTITDDATGAFIARLERAAALGELTAPLGSGPAAMWDMGNVLEVRLQAGHVASVDDGVALGGGNRIAVETDSGGWEVIGFASAELVAPATYRLTRLLRGEGGTDVGTGTASAGARAVVLDESVRVVDIPAGWVGDTVTLRAYAGASDPAGTAIVVNLPLAPLLPLPPVHLCAQRLANGDVAIRWVRRSRADTQNWAPVEVPLDNVPEAYRVTILDGATVIRELEVTTPAATYAAADQAADFGALPPVFGFTVRQVSPVYGPGHPASGEFHD